MGTYDTIVVLCPNCGARVHFQSKAGICQMLEYTVAEAPAEIKADLITRKEKCTGCGKTVKLIIKPMS